MWTLIDAIDSSPILSFVINQHEDLVVFCGGLAEQLKIDRQSIIGRSAFSINHLPVKKNHFRLAMAGNSFSTSVTIEGRSYETTLTPVMLQDENIEGVSCFTIDVTESLELEQFLNEERHRVFTSQRLNSLASITQGLAHEINNPLAIISGYAEQLLMLSEQEPYPKERIHLITQKIHEASQRCGAIIRSLKDFSRDGSHDPFELSSLTLLIDDTLRVCAQKIKSAGIELQLDDSQSVIMIECRIAQIKQVFYNLLVNSIEACQRTDHGKISIKVETTERLAQITLHDNGSGITESIRHRIFEPFFTTKKVGSGAGVGLSMAKGIVEDHGGTLELVPSKVGTTLQLRIPLRRAQAASA
ncbi:MAG: sensor histidine kinase [Oligoflexus sp.]